MVVGSRKSPLGVTWKLYVVRHTFYMQLSGVWLTKLNPEAISGRFL